MTLAFPCGHTCNIAIKPQIFVLRMLCLYLLCFQQSRFELNLQIMRIVVIQMFCDVDSVGQEHIVSNQDRFAIQPDMCEGIEAVKCEDCAAATGDIWSLESGPVGPGFRANPFCFDLIEAHERIF